MTTKDAVQCDIADGVALITMDDGKNNLISPSMIQSINAALDRAEEAGAVVVLTGRESVFSAGFDLAILKTGVKNTFAMLMGGFKLSRRLLAFPTPVVIACNGHAIAMGSFLLLSGDYRVVAEGDFKLVANEVAIGLTMPYSAVEICRQRLKPGALDRTVLLAESCPTEQACVAGFADAIAPQKEVLSRALDLANGLAELDMKAHAESKLRMRDGMLKALDEAIEADRRDFIVKGVKRVLKLPA